MAQRFRGRRPTRNTVYAVPKITVLSLPLSQKAGYRHHLFMIDANLHGQESLASFSFLNRVPCRSVPFGFYVNRSCYNPPPNHLAYCS